MSTTRICAAALAATTLFLTQHSTAAANRVQAQSSTPEGLALLHSMQKALGGAKKLAGVRDYEETITAVAFDSRGTSLGEVRKRTRWIQKPSTLRLDQVGPRGTYVLYMDGTTGTGWEILPDVTSPDLYKTTGKAVDLVGGELEFAKAYLSGFDLNIWLADTHGYTVTSPKPNVLRIVHDGKANDFTLDATTHLPTKSNGVSLADPDRPVPSEMHYEAWKEFEGVRFPTRRVNYLSGVNRGEVTTDVIRVNKGLKAADLAAKPADFAPQIPPKT